MSTKYVLQVRDEEAGVRLDAWVSRHLPDISRSQVKRLIDGGWISVGLVSAKAGYAVRPRDVISVLVPDPPASRLTAESIPLSIVYEDSDLIVVDKPAGMVVHVGAGVHSGTLVNALLHRFGSLSSLNPDRPGIVHRLDKGTSGLIVVAKNDRAHRALSEQFKARQIRKGYRALVYGSLKRDTGSIEAAIGRDPFDRKKISTRARHARSAVTGYRVLERLPGFTLLDVFPETGRTHQIRVHLQHLNHPVVGDGLYGTPAIGSVRHAAKRQAIEQLGRLFLHAASLEFTHPGSGKTLSLAAPLPRELQQLLNFLR